MSAESTVPMKGRAAKGVHAAGVTAMAPLRRRVLPRRPRKREDSGGSPPVFDRLRPCSAHRTTGERASMTYLPKIRQIIWSSVPYIWNN